MLITAVAPATPRPVRSWATAPPASRHAFARAAVARGARVTLIAANVALPDPAGVDLVRVGTTAELREATLAAARRADVVVMAAAPADFRPAVYSPGKIKKSDDGSAPPIELLTNPDIAAELGRHRRPEQVLVVFAAETGDAEANGRAKLARKRADLIVINEVGPDKVFGAETNAATVVGADGSVSRLPEQSKEDLADGVWDLVVPRLAGRSAGDLHTNTPRAAQCDDYTSAERIFQTLGVRDTPPLHVRIGTEGHPDKIADQISDGILDALLAQDPHSRVAVETLITTGQVHVAGEVTTNAYADIPTIVRETILGIGYDSSKKGFDGASCGVSVSIGAQSPDIAQGVDNAFELRTGASESALDAQAPVTRHDVRLACSETPELMPCRSRWRTGWRVGWPDAQGRDDSLLRPTARSGHHRVHGLRPVRLNTVVVSTHRPDISWTRCSLRRADTSSPGAGESGLDTEATGCW